MNMNMKMRSEKDGDKGIKGRGEICLKNSIKTSRTDSTWLGLSSGWIYKSWVELIKKDFNVKKASLMWSMETPQKRGFSLLMHLMIHIINCKDVPLDIQALMDSNVYPNFTLCRSSWSELEPKLNMGPGVKLINDMFTK